MRALQFMRHVRGPLDDPASLRCASCAHFSRDAARIESQLPGLASLSSGFASVRGDDGLCERHQRVLGAAGTCGEHSDRGIAKTAA